MFAAYSEQYIKVLGHIIKYYVATPLNLYIYCINNLTREIIILQSSDVIK